MSKIVKSILLCILLLTFLSSTSLASPTDEVILRYLGHSAFLISHGDKSLLIDPYVNPATANTLKPQYILVTHNHHDHIGETNMIAKNSGAIVLAPAGTTGKQQSIINIGEKKEYDFGWVLATPAKHPEASGTPVGYIINYYGVIIYHAGDTHWLSEIKTIAQENQVEVALLPIGGKYTTNIDEAVKMVALISPKIVIPMHYDTFPDIQASPDKFKKEVERTSGTETKILYSGQKLVLRKTQE